MFEIQKCVHNSGRIFIFESSQFCFETVAELRLDEEYCILLSIFLLGSLWLDKQYIQFIIICSLELQH